MSAPVNVTLHGFAHGGEAVGRLPDGRAVFVAFGIPGETVRVRITAEHKRWCRAVLVEVLTPSADRVEPPCPYFGPGRCGGCQLQHIAANRRLELLQRVVIDQLERVGHVADPPVAATESGGHYGYRNRARFAVDADGALGFRRHGSHDVLPIDRCLLLDLEAQRLREAVGDEWAGASELEVRAATEGTAVVRNPVTKPKVVIGERTLVERVADLEFRVSATSFFQSNRAGAEVLLRLVREFAAVAAGDTALDLYAGVGLFAAGLAADGATVTAVESHHASAADARHNLSGEVVEDSVERTVAAYRRAGRRFDIVVLDPPRRGAGPNVTTDVAALAGRCIVIVACDPATLARDTATLHDQGWTLRQAVPVDQFAQTGHVEVVAVFTPSPL